MHNSQFYTRRHWAQTFYVTCSGNSWEKWRTWTDW